MTELTPADGVPERLPPPPRLRQPTSATGPSRRLGPRRAVVVERAAQGAAGASIWHTAATTAVISGGLCLGVGLYAAAARPGVVDRVLLCVGLLVPAIALAANRSTLLLDYLLVIVVVNRELRRLMDWGQGRYDPTPLLSLLPLVIVGLMALVVAGQWLRLSHDVRRAGGFLLAAMAYGMALGVVGYGLPALYACAEWTTPLIVLYYCMTLRPSVAVIQRWMVVLGTLGVLAGAYGVYQWTDPPPWDAAWVVWSKMTTSMGPPLPYQMGICSTLESRGPAAMFFAAAAAALVGLPFLRQVGGVLLATVPALALLLTQARTGLIYLVLSLLATALFARRGGVKIILALVAAGGVTVAVLGRQEKSAAIFDRVGTLTHLEEDGSATGRVGIASQGALVVLSRPQGFGFGSGGNALKVAGGVGEGDAVGDNGYLEILSTLGLPGTLLYGTGLWLLVRRALRHRRLPTATEPGTQLGLGMLVAVVPALMVANQLISAHAAYMWILLSRHLAARLDQSPEARNRPRGVES